MRRLRPTVHLRRQLERQLDPAGMFPPSDRLEWDATLNAPIPPECACQVPPVGLGLLKKKPSSQVASQRRVLCVKETLVFGRPRRHDVPATGVAGCGRTRREAAAAAGQPTASSPEASHFFLKKKNK